MEWNKCSDKLPQHMQEVKVYIENPSYNPYEYPDNAIYLAFSDNFDDNFFNAEEQITLNYVTKWKPLS